MTDEALFEQSRKGSDEAFRLLYEKYRDPLFRFAWRLTGSAGNAEDLVHDSFLGLFRGNFDPRRGALKTWLFAAVRNLARKLYRDRRSEDAMEEPGECTQETGGALAGLISRETAEEVRNAVASLPLQQREVLVLFEYEELSLAEIGKIVDADVGAVKSRLFRARDRLRKALAGREISR